MRALLMDKKKKTELPYLCFTAEEANSTVKLIKNWSPTEVILEISTDWNTWTDYTIWDTITLANIGDKIYWRNKSETVTGFSTSASSRYTFSIWWKAGCSWDIWYLLCKNSTNNLWSNYCFCRLFYSCTWLTTAPALPATNLGGYCYYQMLYWCTALTTAPALPATTFGIYCYFQMFRWCTALTTITSLPATTLQNYCYSNMFYGCSSIKLSATQDSDYTQEYRIPTEWTWTTATGAFNNMLIYTWWTFTSNPSINTTYYLHKDNTIV